MTTTASFSTAPRNRGFSLSALGTGLVTAFRISREADQRLAEVRRLHGLSDDALARRGLTRDGINRHVFADLLA